MAITKVTDESEQELSSQGLAALLEQITNRSARVGVIGMGYMGLPTMVAAAEGGFNVVGIDVSESRVGEINAGRSYIEDVEDNTLSQLVTEGKISATIDYSIVNDLDVVLVCVPTPLTKNKEPDLTPLEQALDDLASNMRWGQLVILQSTSFPGTTDEFALPKLQKAGWQPGSDFYLAFALERVDPGNSKFVVRNVPKVVGGVTGKCTEAATVFFSAFVDQVVPVSSPKVAEMTKLLENTFRSVNIALVNEMAMLCRRMEIDIWEVIDAASTKPFGFMPFYPGPGVGGHCIPIDPFYLAWKAREHDFYVNFIQLAAEINGNMPYYTLSRIVDILGDHGKPLKNSRLLILGVTFKENTRDTRNSPAVRVMELLAKKGANVAYHDNNAPNLAVSGTSMESTNIDYSDLKSFDAVIILVNHSDWDLEQIIENSQLVIDARNATGPFGPHDNVVKL